MEFNKKLIKHAIIFNGIGIVVYVVFFYLIDFKILDIKNIANFIIVIILEIFCISYYAFIYYSEFLIRNSKKDCIILFALTLIHVPEFYISNLFFGIHQSINLMWLGVMMCTTAHSIASYLYEKEKDVRVIDRKYSVLVTELDRWGNMVFIPMIVALGPCIAIFK